MVQWKDPIRQYFYVDLTNENPDSVKTLLDKVSIDLEIGIKLKFATIEDGGLLFQNYYKQK